MGLIIHPQLTQGLHASTEFPLNIPGTHLGCALHGLTLPILLDPLLSTSPTLVAALPVVAAEVTGK